MDALLVLVAEDPASSGTLCRQLSTDIWGRPIRCECVDPLAAWESLSLLRPDVMLLGGVVERGLAELPELRRHSPATRILLRLPIPTVEWVLAAVHWGACGVIRSDDPPRLVARAVRRVSQGDVWFGRGALFAALQVRASGRAWNAGTASAADARLTPREEEVLRLIGSGLSNKEIARQLQISDKTVKTHLHRVYVKLNQSGRYKALLTQVADRGRELGWGPVRRLTATSARH